MLPALLKVSVPAVTSIVPALFAAALILDAPDASRTAPVPIVSDPPLTLPPERAKVPAVTPRVVPIDRLLLSFTVAPASDRASEWAASPELIVTV